MSEGKRYLEKYFDQTYQREYYHDPATGESLWELPDGAIVADMTLAVKPEVEEEEVQPKKTKKSAAEEKKKEEFRKRQAEIEKLKSDNFQAMYPEEEFQAGEEGQSPGHPEIPDDDLPKPDEEAEAQEQKIFRLFRNQ